MSSQLRKCKECGKTFLPKGRELYCPDIHYRPCPICGTPVEAKYLSDPPRKCDNCKRKKSTTSSGFVSIPSGSFKLKPDTKMKPKSAQRAVEPASEQKEEWLDNVEIVSTPTIDSTIFCENVTGTVMVYVGQQFKNSFERGHKYLLKVERSDYVYNILSTEDLTTGDDCDIIMPVASQISFYQKFAKVKEVQ